MRAGHTHARTSALHRRFAASSARKNFLRWPLAIAIAFAVFGAADSQAAIDQRVATFAVLRNGERIGTNTVEVSRQDDQTDVRTETHVEVSLAFITLYRFDQTETEKWARGRFLAMSSTTDDNGTVHNAKAVASSEGTLVQSDGDKKLYPGTVIPVSLWNPDVLDQRAVLNPQDGHLVPIKVQDRGEDNLVVQGHALRAHHFVIMTTYAQDVWYDGNQRLVQVQLKARDGSTIYYRLV